MPVILFQGSLDEKVPPGQGRWLARKIPSAQLIEKAGESHISIGFRYRQEIMDTGMNLLTA